jgi:hypothetical protein
VLVELSVVEQRYHAVMEVLASGVPVTEVAERYGVSRQSVHTWIRRYQADGFVAYRIGRTAPRISRGSWPPRWRRSWWGCGGLTRGGVRAGCCSNSLGPGWTRRRPGVAAAVATPPLCARRRPRQSTAAR